MYTIWWDTVRNVFNPKTSEAASRERCSLLMLTRELINRGRLYVIKSIEHSDLHWSRSSLLLALCCSLVDESKTSISTKKKKWKKKRGERTWVFPLQLPIHRAPLLDALHGSTQPWKQSQLVWEWFFSCTLITCGVLFYCTWIMEKKRSAFFLLQLPLSSQAKSRSRE